MKNKFIIVITAIATTIACSGKTIVQEMKEANDAWTAFYNAHQDLRAVADDKKTEQVKNLLANLDEWSNAEYGDDTEEKTKARTYKALLDAWLNAAGSSEVVNKVTNLRSLLDAYLKAVEVYYNDTSTKGKK